jgi:ABC-2 type transport system permease protein
VQTLVYFFATCAVYRYQILHTRRHALERLNYMKERAQTAKARNQQAAKGTKDDKND